MSFRLSDMAWKGTQDSTFSKAFDEACQHAVRVHHVMHAEYTQVQLIELFKQFVLSGDVTKVVAYSAKVGYYYVPFKERIDMQKKINTLQERVEQLETAMLPIDQRELPEKRA